METSRHGTGSAIVAPEQCDPQKRRSRTAGPTFCGAHQCETFQRAGLEPVCVFGHKDVQLADEDAEIEPVPTNGGGHRPDPELDRLSNILKSFNDQFGNIPWTDGDRVHRLITEDIPNRVAADRAYQNAKQNSDRQNARIEHDKALRRVMTGLLQDDTELFKQFSDNESFRRWLTDTVFSITYEAA